MLKSLVCLIGEVLLILVAGIGLFAVWFAIKTRPRRRRELGFEFIYVEDDGNARELDSDEREYLNTEFLPGDGARPYIKFRYESLTPDGRVSGYLRRRQLPKGIPILHGHASE